MYISFFEICFECDELSPDCELCMYYAECGKFMECFGYIPKIQLSKLTSFDDIINCLNKWREYNNGTSVKN